MKVWKYTTEEDAFGVLVTSSMSYEVSTAAVDPLFQSSERLGSCWIPLLCDLYMTDHDTGDPLKRTDLSYLDDGGLLVANDKARALIQARFGEVVEFLPLAGEAHGLWVMHVLNSVDSISEELSTPLFEDMDMSTTPFTPIGRRIGFSSPYYFVEDIAEGLSVFNEKKLRRGWFVGQEFHRFLMESGLTGGRTRLIFDSEEHARGFDYQGEPRLPG